MSEPSLLTRHQVAQLLAQSLRSVDQLLAKGEIEIIKIGRSVRIDPSALDRFIESRRTKRNPRKIARKSTVKARTLQESDFGFMSALPTTTKRLDFEAPSNVVLNLFNAWNNGTVVGPPIEAMRLNHAC